MSKLREVEKVFKGYASEDGAGVKLYRVIGHNGFDDALDPFLLLDAFDSTNPKDYIKGFPFHPHRGMQTITYLISGDIEHQDSLGNKGSILDGDAQYMTAGSGIIHQEMPKPSKRMLGVQVWVNLPKKDKMCEPEYGNIVSKNVAQLTKDGVTLRVIAGECLGKKANYEAKYVKTNMIDFKMDSGARFVYVSKPATTLFVYIFEGSLAFNGTKDFVPMRDAVVFKSGDELDIEAGEDGARFLLFEAKPLHEEVAWYGPIVMNTWDEINETFQELNDGTFIKDKPIL
jgi:redox-sensitive bicupin YhaK (pirin superfamily)